MVAIHQEVMRPGASLNKMIRKYVYEQGNLEDYLASDPLNHPFDDVVPECDFETMSPKQFFNEYVRTQRPCLFKNYGRQQIAFQKWQNESYLHEAAGEEIIFAEKQTNNRFAYFTEGAKRVYMTYGDFLDAFKVENRTFHYYYSFAEPPGPLAKDLELPALMNELFYIDKVTYWHGHGTLTRPHTDSMENMMCVYEGWKEFWLVSPADRKFLYTGTEGYPDNYSPLELLWPDYEKYPMSRYARTKMAHIDAGDCLFVPAYYWHQVNSSPEVSIGVATFFKTYHQSIDLFMQGFQGHIL